MRRRADETVRVWVLGCATGEEAYSMAILLREAMAGMDLPPLVQIFATDIDARALAIGRAGRYPQSIEKHVSPERLARWFIREGGTYVVHRDLREMCIFSAHNVIKDPPFSRMDLVSCRNLLIYLKADLQERVIPLFHFALRAGGYLLLGPSENVTRHPKLFQPVDRRHRVFRRLDTSVRILPELPINTVPEIRRAATFATGLTRAPPGNGIARRAERVIERYTPAYVIVDGDHEVLNFSGRTGRFLDPSSGAATLNLLGLVHRDLRIELRAALHKAAQENTTVRVPPVSMGEGGDTRRIGLTVEPLYETPPNAQHYVVLFHDYGPTIGDSADAQPGMNAALLRDEVVLRLEAELKATRERLQTTVEELETTNEELKSSNEEYHSINEELQSANEELETAKEELQSINEELQTLNGELAQRVSELAHTNSDLKNLLESTQIATVFLDNELHVKSFTPAMAEVFHLIENDIGRPIAHITARVDYPELADDVRRVLRRLSAVERHVTSPEGRQFLVRVLPYRSVDNFIAGALLTFLDVSETVRAEVALRHAEVRMRLANTAGRIVTWELETSTGRFSHVADFERTFGVAAPETLTALLAIVHEADRDALAKRFETALAGGDPVDAEARLLLKGRELWIRFTALLNEGYLHGLFQDVSDRHRVLAQQRLLLGERQHRVKNILAVVQSVARRTLDGSNDLEDFRGRFLGRLEALARTQGLLANRGTDGIALESLVADEVLPKTGNGDQILLQGPPVMLKDRAAEVFALALHELATNAAKYGALAQLEGRLAVEWRVVNTSEGARLALDWRESGVRIGKPPERNGFGRSLIERGLPYDLGAATSLEFAPEGVRCTVELPVGPQIVPL